MKASTGGIGATTSPSMGCPRLLPTKLFADPNRLVIDPDPASVSGRTIRVIGWAASVRTLVTIIVLPDEDVIWGVNAWPSNTTDQRRYREERTDVD